MRRTNPAKLSMWGFLAITVVMVMDLHEYTVFATSGFQLVFFLLVGGLLWFIPVAFCSAEMATVEGWQEGGIFTWIEKTLGRRFGFAAVFFQWFQVTVGFITMLYFVFSAVTSLLPASFPGSEPWIIFVGIMIIFWGLTIAQLGGVKRTELIGRICLIIGILLPAAVLAILFAVYVANGNPLQIEISPIALIPDFGAPATLVVFVAFVLSYAGIEASASYANELAEPKKDYPRAIILVVVLAIILNTIGGLSIAAVVPVSELSMSGGMMQALGSLFEHAGFNVGWAASLVALCIAIGVIGEISSWILGPAREMYAAAQQGLLPALFKKVNAKHVPVPLILAQGVVVTVWAAVLTFGGGSGNVSFLVAISLTAVIYLLAYLLLFAGYFVLVFKHSDLPRSFQISGGKPIKIVFAGCGLLVSLFALGISFVPPETIAAENSGGYELILTLGFLIVAVLPFVIYHFRNKQAPRHVMRRIAASELDRFTRPRARGVHHIEPKDDDALGPVHRP